MAWLPATTLDCLQQERKTAAKHCAFPIIMSASVFLFDELSSGTSFDGWPSSEREKNYVTCFYTMTFVVCVVFSRSVCLYNRIKACLINLSLSLSPSLSLPLPLSLSLSLSVSPSRLLFFLGFFFSCCCFCLISLSFSLSLSLSLSSYSLCKTMCVRPQGVLL